MQRISDSTTIELTDHPYLRHHVDPAAIRGIWRHRSASVFMPVRDVGEDPGLVCLGDRDDLAQLLDDVAPRIPTPSHLSVAEGATDALPPNWPVREWNGWTAFSTSSVPDVAGTESVVRLPLEQWATTISTFLDASSPDGWGRPGRDDSQWWGVLDSDGTHLLAVGAVRTGRAPSAHLSGIATHPSARGRGLGRAVTAVLTRVGLDAGQPMVTLDAYSSNSPALRLYVGLGYDVDARFVSGEVGS